ncbi:hypothetical protein H6P81_002719 [Aristolochia fimbriata]|uniref:Uncharacterized protein n=1 Tax=Aristolochia fimbriata TaxID=158543 RepID=A0AAV7FBP8_ARIFI|nr:hypothetical protein H6P81_002719 [Aristolochia fimbriata]
MVLVPMSEAETCVEYCIPKCQEILRGASRQGWSNERLISAPSASGDRIILVLSADAPFQRHKVQEVLKIMERDWLLLHELCKVALTLLLPPTVYSL